MFSRWHPALLPAVALVASCTTAGTPVAERAVEPAPVIAAPTSTAPPSDEDQIRQTVQAFQDAYNTQNWDAYTQQMCPSMRERFTGPVMEMLEKTRTDHGLTRANVSAVVIDGDAATATLDSHNEALGDQPATMPLERTDDGWKICFHY